VKFQLPTLVIVAALVLATSACTSTPEATTTASAVAQSPVVTAAPDTPVPEAPDPTPTPDSATYATVDDLRAALISAGQSCSSYKKVTTVAKATGAATCGSKLTIAVFATAADRDEMVNAAEAKTTPDLILVGANWVVVASEQNDDLSPLQLKLGGFIVPQGS
jgi:maltose-binding protein MalE